MRITAEEARIEDAVLEAVLGEGIIEVPFACFGRPDTLTLRWPCGLDERRVRSLAARYSPPTGPTRLAVARATLEVLYVHDGKKRRWLPLEGGRPVTALGNNPAPVLALYDAWVQLRDECRAWLNRDHWANLRRLTEGSRELADRDRVAREMNTHPFDPRVLELNELQMAAMLQLRDPITADDIAAHEFKRQGERVNDRDVFHMGEATPEEDPENDPEYAWDFASRAQ